MKKLFLAAVLSLAPLQALAQDEGVCYTPAMVAQDVAKVPNAKEIITLRSIDIGFSDLADVTIWGDGAGKYLSVAFIGGCYVGYRIMDDEQVAAFINEHTKRASPNT